MKFLQVHTFYPSYLRQFYNNNKNLANLSFLHQMDALISDGFGATHMIAPHLQMLGYEANLIIANCPESQVQWLNEHQLNFNEQNWLKESVQHQIEYYKPDILYLSDPITFDSSFVRQLLWKPRLVMGWRASTIPVETDWSSFDIMLSNVHGCLEEALRRGAKSIEFFMPGFPSFLADAVINEDKKWDVVFSGQLLEDLHRERREFVKKVVEASSVPYFKFSIGLFAVDSHPSLLPESLAKINQGARWGLEMHRILKQGRIVLNPIGTDLFGSFDHINMRHIELTGTGSFMLTNEHENIRKYFTPGVEIETFRDEKELVDKIRYYLSHPDEREAIARRGQERCLREYSMEKRAVEVDRIIRVHMAKVSAEPATKARSVEDLKSQAAQLIDSGNIQAAFDVLVKAKALKQPLEGLDVLRAHCFLEMGQPTVAVEALREEIRWFPANREAKELLNNLQAQIPNTPAYKTEDEDFNKVLEVIRPYTMLSEQRLYSLYQLARHICENNIQGNFVECGVAAGGSSALLAWVIKKYSVHPRRLFSFDSFSGMPTPTADDSHQGVDAESTGWGTGTCSAPEASVREICTKLGVEDVLTTVKGYFEDTLPQLRDWVGMVALLHMDGDWYESTKAILTNLYGRLVNNALIQVDDYGHWAGCRKAIHEFTSSRSLDFEMQPIDGTGVWFRKPDKFRANPEIPQALIDNFIEDDPVPLGIVSQMSANERFQLYWAIRTLLPLRQKPLRFIEIGSFSGASLVLTCKAFHRLGVSYQGVSVEPGGTVQFHDVINHLKEKVVHLPLFSHQASLRLKGMFDANKLPEFIFVDGDHSYEGVRQDIVDYYDLLAPGGIMMFHDYLPELNEYNRPFINYHHGNAEPGIGRACKEVLEEVHGLAPLDLPLLYPEDPTQTQPHLPIIPGVYSTVRAYRKPSKMSESLGNSKAKIVQLCTSTYGGAAKAAGRLHSALRLTGLDSTLLTLAKDMADPTIRVIHNGATTQEAGCSKDFETATATWQKINCENPNRPQGLEMFSSPDSDVHLGVIDEIVHADIVHLHWVAGLVDYDDLGVSLRGKKVVWTLHDMNPFTGGCHYAGDCLKYMDTCGACPQLGSHDEEDLSRQIWTKKQRGLKGLDITVVTPSKWLASCATQSSIFKDHRVVCIPNGLPLEIYHPYDRMQIRDVLAISHNSRVILFGADNLANERKGFVYLLEALNRFKSQEHDEIVLAVFGRLDSRVTINSPYPIVQLGNITDESHLACIYSMADMFVIPSLEDNLPNTVIESLSCGTPVLGFAIGGIPDMVEHEKTGYLAAPRDVDGLVAGINWLLSYPEMTSMRFDCRRKAERVYSLSTLADRMQILYGSLLGQA